MGIDMYNPHICKLVKLVKPIPAVKLTVVVFGIVY